MFKKMILNLFSANVQTTVLNSQGNDLSPEMKTYYSDYLIDEAEPNLVHDQFGQKHAIPVNGGKIIEFRKYDSLPKALTPLVEGVVPDGQSLNVTTITATVAQFGGYITISDMLILTAIDNNIVEATQILGSQAGRTLDSITREKLMEGTSVLYSGGKTARYLLSGGGESGNCYLTVDDVKRAVRALKKVNCAKVNGYYWGIIHPDCEYDLMNDNDWKTPHSYVDTSNLYVNELGEVAGVRFVESTEAKVFHGSDLASDSRTLTLNGALSAGAITSITFDGGTVTENALKGRYVIVGGYKFKVTANTTTTLTVDSVTIVAEIADNTTIYPGEGGAEGRDVYATLIGGANAYGVTEVTGGGLQHFVKALGSAGTSDPINQISTVGWKATKTAEILVQQYMVRIESCSTFNDIGEN